MTQTRVRFRSLHKTLSRWRLAPEATAVSPTFRLSVGSHLAAIAVGAVAATAYLTVYSASPQSLADYISAICAKAFGSAPAAEAPYLAENVTAMTKMMIDMGVRPSGDVDADFVAMMVPHHQGAIEMAQAELRYGRNEPLRRMAQEIIVTSPGPAKLGQDVDFLRAARCEGPRCAIWPCPHTSPGRDVMTSATL